MKLAVVCASGIGDALILEVVSNAVRQIGWEATTFSHFVQSFGIWLPPKAQTDRQPALNEIEAKLSSFDAIFLQHDNSPKAFKIQTLKIPVYTFYGAYVEKKHGPFDPKRDFAANRSQTMVENISAAAFHFFGVKSEGNGFVPPAGLIHKRHKRRIAIHPTASSEEKIWPKEKFLQVEKLLKNQGYDPVFTVAPDERSDWQGAPLFPSLGQLASFIYESGAFFGNDSGTAHLASLLKIPHLVIAGNGLQMPLWKTGWHPGFYVSPPSWLMKFKYLRNRWKSLISVDAVIKNLNDNVLRN